MKALIYGDIFPETVDCSIAFHGLEDLNYDITISKKWLTFNKEDFEQFDICAGGVDICRFALNKIGIKNYDIPCYPTALYSYLLRNIQIIKTKDFYKIKGIKFVKPVRPKRFQAFLTSDNDKLMYLMNLEDDEQIYISDIVKFESEWRVYIEDKNIKVICNYNGNPKLFPDVKTIESMIDSWQGPCCYVLDVGLINNSTVLVEFNDFYSIGNYGVFPCDYAKMLLKRWTELRKSK